MEKTALYCWDCGRRQWWCDMRHFWGPVLDGLWKGFLFGGSIGAVLALLEKWFRSI